MEDRQDPDSWFDDSDCENVESFQDDEGEWMRLPLAAQALGVYDDTMMRYARAGTVRAKKKLIKVHGANQVCTFTKKVHAWYVLESSLESVTVGQQQSEIDAKERAAIFHRMLEWANQLTAPPSFQALADIATGTATWKDVYSMVDLRPYRGRPACFLESCDRWGGEPLETAVSERGIFEEAARQHELLEAIA